METNTELVLSSDEQALLDDVRERLEFGDDQEHPLLNNGFSDF